MYSAYSVHVGQADSFLIKNICSEGAEISRDVDDTTDL